MLEDNDCLSPPGKSTLYRLIPKLLAENTIKQFSDSRGKRAAYQIVGGTECRRHIHLKCTICGKIFHMSEEATSALCKCVSGSDAFRISTEETILYGICKDCV